MAKQFIFTLEGRDETGVVFFQNVPAVSIQQAVNQYKGKGFLFKAYQNRMEATAWVKAQDVAAEGK